MARLVTVIVAILLVAGCATGNNALVGNPTPPLKLTRLRDVLLDVDRAYSQGQINIHVHQANENFTWIGAELDKIKAEIEKLKTQRLGN